jgi:hypothetical protein
MRPARTNLKSVLYQAAGRGWCCHPTTPYSWGGRAQVLTRVLAYFANPHNVTRTFMLAIVDIGIELWTSAQQRRRDVLPRIRRSLGYAFARAFTTVVQRDLQVQVVEFDILCGRPVEGPSFLRASLTEVAEGPGLVGRTARFLAHRRAAGGDRTGPPPEVVVMASGCFGLISFPREAGRLSLERIDSQDPLEPFGPNAAAIRHANPANQVAGREFQRHSAELAPEVDVRVLAPGDTFTVPAAPEHSAAPRGEPA